MCNVFMSALNLIYEYNENLLVFIRKPGKTSSGDKSPLDALEEEQWEEFLRLQIENTALLRTCQELSQQLADLKEDKMKLKVKLEQLESLQNGA